MVACRMKNDVARRPRYLYFLLSVAVVACTGGETDPPPGLACPTHDNSAAVVNEVRVPVARATAAGGVITEGLYHQTGSEVFTGPGGASGPTGKTRKNTIIV